MIVVLASTPFVFFAKDEPMVWTSPQVNGSICRGLRQLNPEFPFHVCPLSVCQRRQCNCT